MTKMNESKALSIEQAIINYTEQAMPKHFSNASSWKETISDAFEGGAQWQKEQLKGLKDAAREILKYYCPNTYDPGHKAYKALKEQIENYNNQP